MRIKIKRAIAFSIAACAVGLAGCSSRETQQQKYIEAISHGNSAQASQIWLHMDANSRADFAYSRGMQPNMSPDDVKKQVMQHYEDENKGDNGNVTSEATVEQTPNVHLGGLETLPGYVGPSADAPARSATAPLEIAPAN